MSQTICPLIFASKNIATVFRNRDSPDKVRTYGMFFLWTPNFPLRILPGAVCWVYTCACPCTHTHWHTHTDTQWCPGRKRCHSNNTTCAASAQPGLRVALKPAGGRVRSWGASFWAPHLTVCTWWTGRLTSWNFHSLYVESVCNI